MLATSPDTTSAKPASQPVAQRARGTVDLSVVPGSGQSRIGRLYQSGCAKARIPRTTGSALEAVLINSSGGMTGGDKIGWQVEVENEAFASITSQACERVYKAPADTAEVTIDLQVGRQGKLAWLPQETILFDHGHLRRTLSADLDETAEALFVESVIFGRGAMGEQVTQGSLHDRWRIRQAGKLIHAEDLRVAGAVAAAADQPFTLDGNGAMATLLLVSPSAEGHLSAVRNILTERDSRNCGASVWNGKLLARVMAKDGYELRKKLVPLINLLNFEAQVPKVWAI